MKIAVIGTGYVGLVSGVCLAFKGHQVICVDLRLEVIAKLNAGEPHIYENGLESILKSVVKNGNFIATNKFDTALDNSDVVIIAVGTPSKDGEIDLKQIYEVSKQIGEYIKNTDRYISVIVKSTVVPGTTDFFVNNVIKRFSGKNSTHFGLGMNPEFLREGNAMEDFLEPDRVVIGYQDEITKTRLTEMYSPWDCDKIFVNTRTAEMIKYANNTMLATIISLNNELANLASVLGEIDYNDVIRGVASDKRWSPLLADNKRVIPGIINYFTPGVGFGGSCFPKDVEAIRTHGSKMGLQMSLTNATLHLNQEQVNYNLDILETKIGSLNKKNILLLGLAFKADTDDIRDSSALRLLLQFLKKGSKVIAHDPMAIANTKMSIASDKNLTFASDWERYIQTVEIIVIGTNWAEYRKLLSYNESGGLDNKVVFDSKRMFKIDDLTNCRYLTVGYSKETNYQLFNKLFNF